jgi:pyridoxal phosphate enzyme (YggS family)
MGIAERYAYVREQVDQACREAGRDPGEVLLLSVSKTVEAARVAEAIRAGAHAFGENRPEQLVEKQAAYPQAEWHFIGNIQSRRIRDIVPAATLIHSVYKESHLAKIDEQAARVGKVQRILVEVNVSGEESKSGLSPDEVEGFLEAADAFDHLQVAGLMTMAPRYDELTAETTFSGLASLRERLDDMNLPRHGEVCLSELSMGMSEDWRIAIRHGATIIRIGRAIFSDEFEPSSRG